MDSIMTKGKFEAVINEERAILFISYEWSKQALLSKQLVEEWMRTWNIWHPKLSVGIYKLEPDDHTYTWKWLNEKVKERGGYGSLAWIKNGEVVDFEPFVAAAGLRDVARRTQQAFGETGAP